MDHLAGRHWRTSRQWHTRVFHDVLAAKLVTPDGLVVSVGSEFIENADPQASEQDCELKAFDRRARHLMQDFPQANVCLCLDAFSRWHTARMTRPDKVPPEKDVRQRG